MIHRHARLVLGTVASTPLAVVPGDGVPVRFLFAAPVAFLSAAFVLTVWDWWRNR